MHGRTTELGAKLMEYMLGRVALRLVWSLGTFRDRKYHKHAHVQLDICMCTEVRSVAACQHIFLHLGH